MDLRYDGLTIRVGIDVQEVIEFNLEQRLNEHAALRIAFTCKDDAGDAIVKNASEEITIEILTIFYILITTNFYSAFAFISKIIHITHIAFSFFSSFFAFF